MSNGMGFDPKSLAAFTGKLQQVKAGKTKGAVRGLRAATHLILTQSNREVPHESGDTERTGRATVSEKPLAGAVSYKDVEFRGQAAYLHERMDVQHDEGRNAKYLERAFARCRDQVRQILGNSIRSGMGE